jgi:hypothetical protein
MLMSNPNRSRATATVPPQPEIRYPEEGPAGGGEPPGAPRPEIPSRPESAPRPEIPLRPENPEIPPKPSRDVPQPDRERA